MIQDNSLHHHDHQKIISQCLAVLFRHIQEGSSPVQSQYEAVYSIDATFTPEPNGISMKDEALVTETSTFLDNQKKHVSKANIDNHFSIMLPVVVVALVTCF